MSSESDEFKTITKRLKEIKPEKDKDKIKDFCVLFTKLVVDYKNRLPRIARTKRELYGPLLQILLNREPTDEDFNIETILNYCRVNNQGKLQETLEEIKQVTETSVEIAQRTKEEITISTVNYIGTITRTLTIVEIPKRAFYGNVWLYDGSSHIFRPSCKNCPFYLSTGTSNDINFPNVWFPFLRIKETEDKTFVNQDRGWIYKASMLKNSRRFKDAFDKLFKNRNPEDNIVKYEKTFNSFFEKFSHWWQVSISAAMDVDASSVWNHDPFLLKVKILALEYNFKLNPRNDNYFTIKDENEKITRYIINQVENEYIRPEDINIWLKKQNSLCLLRD
jgi:hypothetical protein